MKIFKIYCFVFLFILFNKGKAQVANHYVVTSSNDQLNPFPPYLQGTLRWAINEANNHLGADYIDFNISGTTPQTITLLSDLPYISGSIIIDGNTQPSGNFNGKRIIIKGWQTLFTIYGIGNNSTITGLELIAGGFTPFFVMNGATVNFSSNIIYQNTVPYNYILIDIRSDNNIFKDNIIGTDKNFSTSSNFQNYGLRMGGSNNTFGGLWVNEKNYFYNFRNAHAPLDIQTGVGNKVSGNVFINNKKNIDIYTNNGCLGNNCKQVPVFTVVTSGISTLISGTSGNNDLIEIYKSNLGGIDAIQLLGTVTTNGTGNFNTTVTGLSVGDNVIATATDPSNNTSEFTLPITVAQSTVIICPKITSFTHVTLNPNPCSKIEYNASIDNQSGQGLSVNVNFGDGSPTFNSSMTSTDVGFAGNHTFTSTGIYTMTFTISGPGNCSSSLTQTVAVICNPCPTAIGANYQINPFNIDGNQTKCKRIVGKLLINSGTDTSFTVSMNFGDGLTAQTYTPTSTGITFNHPYSDGTYTVTASINGPGTCVSTYTFVVNIICTPPPCSDCIGSFAPIPDSTYIISAWVKEKIAALDINTTTYANAKINVSFRTGLTSSPGSVSIGTPVLVSPTGLIIDGWQKIEQKFKIPAGAAALKIDLQSSVEANFDDIRVFPFNGSMKSYVYDPKTMRLMAELDERNYATFYEYDEEGKLIRVKKETEKGIMTIKESRNSTPIK